MIAGEQSVRQAGPTRLAVAALFVLTGALLVACGPRFVYEPTPTATAWSYVGPPPTLTPTAGPVTPVPSVTPTPDVPGPSRLSMNPLLVSLAVGETHLVQVWLDDVDGLHGIELHIGFEPLYVQVEDSDPNVEGIQIGAGIVPIPAQVIRNEVDNNAGLIVYHVLQAPGDAAAGDGMVASFVVRGRAEGGSSLRFNIVQLVDAEGQPLQVPEQVIDGLVTIGAGSAPLEPTDEPLPTGTAEPSTETAEPPTPTVETPAVATSTPTPAPTASSQTRGIYHTVQPGENLYRISLHYGTTVEAIVAANHLPSADQVQAGQLLLIPVDPPAGSVAYIVQPGDTLYSIAQRFGTTADALAALNGIAPPYALQVAQVLVIVP